MPIPQRSTLRFSVCLLAILLVGLTSQQSFAFRWGSWLSPSEWQINFGGAQVGTSISLPEVLTNNGYYPVTISSAGLNGAGFTLEGPSLPLTLEPGASVTFNVLFAPEASTDFSGTLSVVWGRHSRTLNIPVVATGTGTGKLSAAPASVSFGSVTVGASSTKTATLTASGSSAVITSVTTTNPEFTVSGVSLPLTLDAGQTASFAIKFTPQTSGTASASLSFVSGGSSALTSETLSGTGASAAQHSVDLTWTESTSGVAGYNVYRAATSGGPYSRVNSGMDGGTNYTDSGVQTGQTYYYVVTSLDAAGAESSYSGEVAATIPAP